MYLDYLPNDIKFALMNVNSNLITEIRLRNGQPVIIEYYGEYKYLNRFGLSDRSNDAIYCKNADEIISAMMGGNVFTFTEQLKRGFITLSGGVRVGIAGEYVCDGASVNTIKNITSLNIRIPHDVVGCAESIYDIIKTKRENVLIYSMPGLGKTTYLRDIAKFISKEKLGNLLIFDERNEITATYNNIPSFDLGDRCDIVRGGNKKISIEQAIRSMKPQIIVCDELYGEDDFNAIKYATVCSIRVIASTHITDRSLLKEMPFGYYVELNKFKGKPIVYDKDFNIVSDNRIDDLRGVSSITQ